jgi:hypothetical protein
MPNCMIQMDCVAFLKPDNPKQTNTKERITMKNENSKTPRRNPKTLRRNPKTGRLPGESKRKTADGYRTICVACGTDITGVEAHMLSDCITERPQFVDYLLIGKGNVDIRKHGSQK